jgi:hypothetical protein
MRYEKCTLKTVTFKTKNNGKPWQKMRKGRMPREAL